jgi:cyanophycinase-like exopeptidase
MKLISALVVVISMLYCALARIVVDNDDYTVWRIPDNADQDATGIKTAPGVALIGGGSDCNQAFAFMINNANRGDFVILRASQSDGYNDYVYDLSQQLNQTLNSVTTVLFKTRAGSYAQEALSYINSAELVFFAGGDQGRYLNFWADTPVQTAVQNKIDNGVTIGGTSAGLAIMGTRVYTSVIVFLQILIVLFSYFNNV